MFKNIVTQGFKPLGVGVERSPRAGFTLAEVLITLGIIGVVAAMTIPTLITNQQQRSWNTAASVFNRRLGEAINLMNSQSSLAGFSTTKDFVNELSKHIKITKICDNVEDCFSPEIVVNNETVDVTLLTHSKNLNSSSDYETETIGVQFANGVNAIIAYNPNCTQDPFSNQIVSFSRNNQNVGLGTDALSILFDVSGNASPNVYGETKDIRGINIALDFGSGVECTGRANGKCILDLGNNFSPIDCSVSPQDSYCMSDSDRTNDYWAGAMKACGELGMTLPSSNEAVELQEAAIAAGFLTQDSYWTSTKCYSGGGTKFSGAGACYTYGDGKGETNSSFPKAFCVD